MRDNALNIISNNVSMDEKCMSNSIVKRKLHLQDLAKIIKETIINETKQDSVVNAIYRFDIVKDIFDKYISILKKDEEKSINYDLLNHFNYNIDKLFVLSLLISPETQNMTYEDTLKMISENDYEGIKNDSSISYVRSNISNIATENFAKVIRGSQLKIKDTYNSVFDDLIEGRTDYAVVPVENSTDGRLGYFRSIIDRNELFTILSTEVEGDSGETTKFDLVCTKPKILNYKGKIFVRFKITLDKSSEISDIQELIKYVGANLEKVYSLSPGETGRDNSFDFICDCTNSNLPMMMCFLKICYPQFIFGGFYSIC